MYGKSKKRRRAKQKKKADSGENTAARQDPSTAVAQDESTNDKKSPQKPNIITRNSSFQDFTVKAPRIAANTAAKIVTGVDMNGMARSQRSLKQKEEQEHQRDFVQNSLGQPVYVGRNKNSSVERLPSNDVIGSASSENLDEVLAGVFTVPPPAADGDELVDPEVGLCDEHELSDDDFELGDQMYSHPQDRGNPFLVSSRQ